MENIKCTWFVRLDKKIKYDFGVPDYLFIKYSKIIEKLKYQGHTIAWHPHFYKLEYNEWKQNTCEDLILDELNYLLPYVKRN